MSRKTLYRIFEDRPALIEHILDQRLMLISSKHKERFEKFEDLKEALIERSILLVKAARKDKLFNEIVRKDTNHQVEQYLLRPNPRIRQAMIDGWSPVIDKGRAKGLVRDNLTNERIVELLGNIHVLLLLRDDYREADQRAFLEDFLVPAVMNC